LNHPTEHKLAAYHYLISQMTALPLSLAKEMEWKTILTIAINNNFQTPVIKTLKAKNVQQ
jgi:hypothetical protein